MIDEFSKYIPESQIKSFVHLIYKVSKLQLKAFQLLTPT
jgi:hypothetical protein